MEATVEMSFLFNGVIFRWTILIWLVLSTHLKHDSQNGFIFPNFRDSNKKYLSCHHLVIFRCVHPWRLTWNIIPWRFGSDHFPFKMGDGCRFQPLIFQGENGHRSKRSIHKKSRRSSRFRKPNSTMISATGRLSRVARSAASVHLRSLWVWEGEGRFDAAVGFLMKCEKKMSWVT